MLLHLKTRISTYFIACLEFDLKEFQDVEPVSLFYFQTSNQFKMKSLNIFLAIAMAVTSLTVSAQNKSTKTESIKVWGNCGMCQTRIEKAAKEAGASEAKWDAESNMLAVTYKTSKTSIKDIEQKVASVGHDTKSFKADDAVYNKLHGCCKYERPAATETASASCCNDKEKCAAMKDKACCKTMDEKHATCAADKSCCAKA